MRISPVVCAVMGSVFALGCELLEFMDVGSGEINGPWINVYSHQVTDGEPLNVGISCGNMGSGDGSTSSGSNEENGYWIEELTNEHGLVVRMHVGEAVTDEHRYDRAFFESGVLDRFVLTAPTGEQFSYSVWGASECQECPTEPYDPLPGDYLCVAADDGGGHAAQSNESVGYPTE